jgi:hypothetical protein
METFENSKGGTTLVYDGFMYTKEKCKTQSLAIRWRCVKRNGLNKCTAILKTTRDLHHPYLHKEHTHTVDFSAIECAKEHARTKKRAKEVHGKPSLLYATAVSHLSNDARKDFVKEDSFKRNIRRYRTSNHPAEPTTIQELHIDGKLKIIQKLLFQIVSNAILFFKFQHFYFYYYYLFIYFCAFC